ncbi:type III-A CRISPR-associated protein Cas10/Csm1 [Chloroflexus aggregans]|uniref:CRISPR system single-strand-specific deoxyribonuclease Cas10/Csm1 (subtype III-A) n=1 Tax=Chloroflexus aggregans (strain MD-66 / DSM 9485) TaxID=326427 RepID=B8G910_CHLAD|nr:CRISPR-associated protein Csm1 [Chloroflexus aggregans]ACL26285.1 CRISPR-associated protein, Csm1 family [Chloroflexus aggregans DSM 9485]
MTTSHPTDPVATATHVLQAWVAAAVGATITASPDLVATAWQIAGRSPQAQWPPLPDHLATVFTRLVGQAPPSAWQPPTVLQCDPDALFPRAQPATPTDELRNGLRTGLATAAQATDPANRLELLLNALQRYGSAWPSPLAAVSLYDLARLHAAVAAALTGDAQQQICLLGGDLSGLQEFLYSIPAEGAARQLRGRSLYLQLLTDACAQWVLRKSGMPLCNLLYAGGGRFYAVLPGRFANEVSAWRRELGQVLLEYHRGALYVALGATAPFAPDQYNEQTWHELTRAIDTDKRRRFAALDDESFARIFQPRPPRPPRSDGKEAPDPLGESLADLGRQLTRAAVLLVDSQASAVSGTTWRSVVSKLGVNYELTEQVRLPVAKRRALALTDEVVPSEPAQAILIGQRYLVAEAYRLRDTDLSRYRALDPSQAEELRPGDVAPFNLLADQSEGISRIAVLRMDVDNLGDLFGRGLQRPAGLAGLAVTAALSSALSRFFEGWVGELCRQVNERSQGQGGIYAVYSGGDDLFLVGSWHLLPELARTIRADFIRYAGGAVTVSAGITLHQAGYPLYQAAEDAGNALDAAKSYEHPDGRSKDAITFLGQTLSWVEFEQAATLKDELIDLIANGAPRSLLMTIQALAVRARQRFNRSGQVQLLVGPWVWQGAYQLTRLAERSGDLRRRIEALREQLLSSEGIASRTIIPAGLAARWAQLLLRGRDTRR